MKKVSSRMRSHLWIGVISVFFIALLTACEFDQSTSGSVLSGKTSSKEIRSETNALLKSWQKYEKLKAEKAPAEDIEKVLAKMVKLAEKRKEDLLKLLESNPSALRLESLPKEIFDALPKSVSENIEKRVKLKGTVRALHADDVDLKKGETFYFLDQDVEDDEDLQLEILLPEEDQDNHPIVSNINREIDVDGFLLEDKIVPDAAALDDDSISMTTEPGLPPQLLKAGHTQKNLIVIRVNFADRQLSGSSNATLQGRIFSNTDSTRNNFLQSSKSHVSYNGSVVGPVNIPHSFSSNGRCNPNFQNLTVQARAAVTNQLNMDISSYGATMSSLLDLTLFFPGDPPFLFLPLPLPRCFTFTVIRCDALFPAASYAVATKVYSPMATPCPCFLSPASPKKRSPRSELLH